MGARPASARISIALLLAALALGAIAFAWIARSGRRPPPAGTTRDAGTPAVVAAAPAAEPGAPARSEQAAPDAEPEPASALPPATEAAAPRPEESVLLTGSAVRIDVDGSEHAGLDGTLALAWRAGGRRELRELEVTAGCFAIEIPPSATLFCRWLTLGGVAVELEQREHAVPADRFLLLRGRALRGVLLHVRAAEDGRELDAVEVRAAGGTMFQTTWQHPGAEPQGEPLVRAGRSPVLVAPGPGTNPDLLT